MTTNTILICSSSLLLALACSCSLWFAHKQNQFGAFADLCEPHVALQRKQSILQQTWQHIYIYIIFGLSVAGDEAAVKHATDTLRKVFCFMVGVLGFFKAFLFVITSSDLSLVIIAARHHMR